MQFVHVFNEPDKIYNMIMPWFVRKET